MNDKAEENKRLDKTKKEVQSEYEKQLIELRKAQPSTLPSAATLEGNDTTCGLNVDTKNPDVFVEAYNLIAKKTDGTYKDGFSEVIILSNGSREFNFPSPEEAGDFFESRAKEGHPFELRDKVNGDLIATSNGDGRMCKPNGQEFAPGEFKNTLNTIFEKREEDKQKDAPSF